MLQEGCHVNGNVPRLWTIVLHPWCLFVSLHNTSVLSVHVFNVTPMFPLSRTKRDSVFPEVYLPKEFSSYRLIITITTVVVLI